MTTKRHHRLLAAATAAVLLVGLTGCAESTKPKGGSGKKNVSLVTDGQLTVCTNLPYKPFQFTDSKTKKVVGFEVDLGKLIAKDLGVKQKVISTPWGGVISGEDFNTDKCDIGYGGATITPGRKKAVAFTKPYLEVKQSVLAKKSSKVKGLADLKGKKVGAQQDTTGLIYANKNKKKYGYKVVNFEDYSLLTSAVRTGQVDASIADSGVLQYYITQYKDTKITTSYHTGEQLGMMTQKGDKAMLKEANKVLDKSKKDGRFDKLHKKWFGKLPEK